MPLGIRHLREQKKRGSLLFALRVTQSDPLPQPSAPTQKSVYLCATCRNADLPGLFTWRDEEPEWDLARVSSNSRCEFCRLLRQLVVDDHGIVEAQQFVEKKAIVRLERCSLWEYKYRGGVLGGVAGRRAAIFSPTATEGDLVRCRHQDPEDGACILPLSRGSPTFGLLQRTKRVDVGLIRTWLKTCDQNHGDECWQTPEHQDVPQFLIDVKKACIVRSPGGERVRYLALSYVWGQIKQPALQKTSLKAWQRRGSLLKLNLPQTIQDAMTLTADLGERFLWVDSLCMVQDELDSLSLQIARMHMVYRQAYLTIIAATGGDSNTGLPGVRNSPSQRRLQIIADIGALQLSTVHIKAHGELRKSIWNSRGWTFQEELCSSRRLVFTQSTVTFNCMAATWREDFPERLIMNSRERYSYLYTAFGSTQTNNDHEMEDIMKWYSVVLQNYLSRKLSDPNDILKAFAGVTSLVSQTLGPSFWGLPEAYFHEAMCWNTTEHALVKRRAGFPSWSWSGYHHPKYRADQVLFDLLPRQGGLPVHPKTLIQFVNLSNPAKVWPEKITGSHPHFKLDLEKLMGQYSRVSYLREEAEYVIGVCTSSSRLLIESLDDDLPGDTKHVCVRCPNTKMLLCTMLANSRFLSQPQGLQDFIVIGQIPQRAALFDPVGLEKDVDGTSNDQNAETKLLRGTLSDLKRQAKMEDSFILMMIEQRDGVAIRQAITSAVPASRWWNTETERKVVILG